MLNAECGMLNEVLNNQDIGR